MRVSICLFSCVFFMSIAWFALAETTPQDDVANAGGSPESNSAEHLNRLADIRVHSSQALEEILLRVDNLFQSRDTELGVENPVVFLLHGSEAKTLFKKNYKQNKSVVDLAAKLSAFGVIDIKVCETWAGTKGLDKDNLQPFVGTVPFAVAEEKRLLQEKGYSYF